VALGKSQASAIFLGSSVGYDSNPGLYEDDEESWFARYALAASRHLASSDFAELKVAADAYYTDYFSLGDNYRLEAGPTLSFNTLKGRIMPTISSGAACYRDHLVKEDERNEYFFRLGVDWIVTPTAIMRLHSEVKRLDYVNGWPGFGGRSRVAVPPGKGGIGGSSLPSRRAYGPGRGPGPNNGGSGEGQGSSQAAGTREDTLLAIGADLDVAFSSKFSTVLYGRYERNHSSIPDEEQHSAEFGAMIEKRWTDLWASEMEASARSAWFDNSRMDKGASLQIRISRFFGTFRLFSAIRITFNDSSAEMESYSGLITECGVSFSY
jgi:hypothetical protein